MKIILSVLFFAYILVHRGSGQSISVNVDDAEISLTDIVKLTFTLENVQGNFEPPAFTDFRVVNGPFSATSMQIVNGKMSSSASYTYVISPKKEGDLYIEEAYVKLADTSLATKPLKIIVSPSAASNKQEIENKIEYKDQIQSNDKLEQGLSTRKKKRKIIKI